jgi:hypothetical protein
MGMLVLLVYAGGVVVCIMILKRRGTAMQQGERIFPFFIGTWLVLMALGFYLFHWNRDATFKKKYFPWFVIFGGILLVVFMGLVGFPREAFLLMVPAVALVSFLNIRGTRFCSSCGHTNINQTMFFLPPKHCSGCGAKLNDTSP